MMTNMFIRMLYTAYLHIFFFLLQQSRFDDPMVRCQLVHSIALAVFSHRGNSYGYKNPDLVANLAHTSRYGDVML